MNPTDKPSLLLPLANRAVAGSSTPFQMPADGWVQLAPIGEFPHPSGVMQVIDAKSVASMADRFAQEMPGGVPGLLLDYEHFSHDPDKSTEAAGWIEGLEARADGLYGQIRYSDDGRAAVAGGRYRFLSPTWLQNDCEWVGDGRLRPLRLNDAGLTNSPNLKGLAPLSNRQQPAAGNPQQNTPTTKTDMEYKTELLKALGLPSDASDSLITTATETVLSNSQKAKEHDALKNKYDTLLASQADSDLDAAGITDPEARKDWKSGLLENRDRTLRQLAGVVKNKGNETAKTLTNRAGANTPDGKTAPDAVADSRTQMAQQQEAIAAVKLANKGFTNTEAFELARKQKPELFKTEQE